MGLLSNPDWGLLGASLLANSAGNYGALGPNLGRAMMSYGAMNQLQQKQALADEQLRLINAEIEKIEDPEVKRWARLNPEKYVEYSMKQKFGTDATLGNTVNYARDASGNLVPWQTSNQGGFNPVQMPEGYQAVQPMQFLNLGSQQVGVNKYTGQPTTSYNVEPKPGEQPSFRAAQTTAVKQAEADVKKGVEQPFAEEKLAGEERKYSVVTQLIDRADKQAGTFTTGFIGNATARIPGTPSHDLYQTLQSIKANLGFDRLQEMRDASPTGGALGQVSEMENKLLQSVWGSLEQSQSEDQFRKNLQIVKDTMDMIINGRRDAYAKKYGSMLKMRGVDLNAIGAETDAAPGGMKFLGFE